MKVKNILFLTGTRADYGKIKPLIRVVESCEFLNYQIFITGMHTLSLYGSTELEIKKDGFENSFTFMNQHHEEPMEEVLSNTITGLSRYVHEYRPDMIVVHGDRVEALAGAIVGSINNIVVAHVEGGEKSGTIDEHIRHSVTKMSHVHFVCTEDAKSRLLQMGEREECVYNIGSPDIDVMLNNDFLPSLESAKNRYGIDYQDFAILMYHPVTTELDELSINVDQLVQSVEQSGRNFIVILPNNDEGSSLIRSAYKLLEKSPNCRIFPSVKFEYFLVLLKNCQFILGNSSAGVREAPVYGVPAINVGNRQQGRTYCASIFNVEHDACAILEVISKAENAEIKPSERHEFGDGDSSEKFKVVVESEEFWNIDIQKVFVDRSVDVD